MNKPKNPVLRRVTDLLDERNVKYEVDARYDLLFMDEKLYVYDVYGHYCGTISPNGDGVRLDSMSLPVEGAVMAICGPDKRLEDGYPILTRHMSFANMSMMLKTDRRDVLMPIERAVLLEEHMGRLLSKVKNQKKDLRRLHLKCMRQQDEILRMEENALRMIVMNEGYAEGE